MSKKVKAQIVWWSVAVPAIIATIFFKRWLWPGLGNATGWIPILANNGMTVAGGVLGGWLATLACKLLGVAASSETVEVIQRVIDVADASEAEEVSYGDADTVGGEWGFHIILALGLFMTFIFLLGTLAWMKNPADDANMTDKIGAPIGLAFFGLLMVGLWLTRKARTVLANERGVFAGYSGIGMRQRIVPWNQIASCHIRTWRDDDGSIADIRLTLKGAGENELATVNLKDTPRHTRENFVQLLEAKLTGRQ